MIGSYRDLIEVLEIEIDKLRDAEDYLNVEGKQLLKAYRKIRELTFFAESCQELIELGVLHELDEGEMKAARVALRTIERIAKAEDTQEGSPVRNRDICEQINAVCDQRCRFRDLEQGELDEKCEECPLNKLAELIGV